MKLYFVMKRNPEYSVVNDDLEIIGGPPEEIVDVFIHEENAEKAVAKYEKRAKELADSFGCDLDEYFIAERDIEEE